MALIGVAIFGSGIFAKESYLPAVQECEQTELKAVYSRTNRSATAFLEGTNGVDIYSNDSGTGKDLDALLARDDIQAVFIALPIMIQPEIIKKCLSAGKHVLSEKPIAPDLASARSLISWRESNIPTSLNWSVAENFRFQNAWYFARTAIVSLGRILNFSVEIASMVNRGGKYFETEWRKVPEYQGGFLLDGGVHSTAALILLLGKEDEVERVSAFTAKNMEYLPPVDTVSAVLRTKRGATGCFAMSFGTTFQGMEFRVACEGGVVTITRSKVVVKKVSGEEEVKEFPEDNGIGSVVYEVKVFAEAIAKGVPDERQTPELAYKDLELIEKMLKSGERDGASLCLGGNP